MDFETAGESPQTSRYDAYISHAEADRHWVDETLAPRLVEAGYRLCLEQDLPPGGIEIEERSRAVAMSRKTLMVVSEAYLANRWTLFQEAVTVELDPAARKRRLIPVLRGGGARLPLRIRPLVAVDLQDESDDRQWRRLLSALDPTRDATANWFQRWSLLSEEATRDLASPAWNGLGAVVLSVVYVAFMAAVSLLVLLFWDVPALRNGVSLVLLVSGHVLAALVWREDRDLFRRWSHLVVRSRASWIGVSAGALLVTALWTSLGIPEARERICGPWGCKEKGKVYLVIDEFAASDGETREHAALHHVVAQKLQEVEEIEVFGIDLPGIDNQARRRLAVDYSLTGQLESERLTVFLWDRHHRPAPPHVVVPAEPTIDTERWMEMSNALVRALLERLGLEPTPELAARIERTPTDDPRAFELNAEGFGLLREGRYDEAFDKFDGALELDPEYSVAWSNLGETAWRLGFYDQALEYRRNAVEQQPRDAAFHYNLGHTLARVGRNIEALGSLSRAIELDPARVQAYNETANVLLDLGEPERAVAELRRALLLEPGFAPASKNLGRALLESDEPRDAVRSLERALDHYPSTDVLGQSEALALLVRALVRLGDEQAACVRLEAVRALDPVGVFPFTPLAEEAAVGLPCVAPIPTENSHV